MKKSSSMEKLAEYRILSDNLFYLCKLNKAVPREMSFQSMLAIDDLVKQVEALTKKLSINPGCIHEKD